MDSVTYLILLRLIHITCGVFWAGAGIYLAAFVMPAVKASGPEGGKFMQQLTVTNKLPIVMTMASTLTIIAGFLLIWKVSNGLQYEWMTTKHGLILNAGALFALAAYLEGLLIIRPNAIKLGKLGQQVGASGSSIELTQQLNIHRKKIIAANNVTAILLSASVIAMSLIRYF